MAVLEDQLGDAEGGPDRKQVGEDPDRGEQRCLKGDEQQQEAKGQDDADRQRGLRRERRFEVVVFDRGPAE